jgi:hypothetical protein
MGKSIDRAEWHYGGGDLYPKELPPENGGTHIGMYLAWIIGRGLASALLQKYARDSLPLLRERKITGRELLFSELDEKFFEGLLTRVGKDFTQVYYDTDCYLEDYAAVLGDSVPTLYHVEDSWANYDKLAPVIDQRFSRWQQGEPPPTSPQQAGLKQAEDEYFNVLLEAGRKLSSDPAGAIIALERYLASGPLPPYRTGALRELEILRAKHGGGR